MRCLGGSIHWPSWLRREQARTALMTSLAVGTMLSAFSMMNSRERMALRRRLASRPVACTWRWMAEALKVSYSRAMRAGLCQWR